MEQKNNELVDGLFVAMPTVSFVKCKIAIKRKDLGNYLRGKEDDWINIDVKESPTKVDKRGNPTWYCVVDDGSWKKEPQRPVGDVGRDAPQEDEFEDKIPF